jgi:ribosomal protein S18 acetylase RimI-like enzyme
VRSPGAKRSADDLSRIIAFVRGIDERTSDSTAPFRWGTAFFNSDLPRIYSLNFLEITDDKDVSLAGLIVAADELQGGAGLGHRRIVCRNEALGRELAPEFAASKWEVECDVVMVHERGPDRTSPPGLAQEIGLDEAAEIVEKATRREPYGKDDATVAQFVRRLDVIARATNLRVFAARIDDHIAAYCELYSDGRTAQIEDVNTLEEYRGRGLARAVILEALRGAEKDGCDLTFLFADDQDWPKELYAKLGFETVGRDYDFTKPRRDAS